jgi:hypothetical protein
MLQVLTIRQGPHIGANLIREARAARRGQCSLLDRMISSLDGARGKGQRDVDDAIEQDVVVQIRRPN